MRLEVEKAGVTRRGPIKRRVAWASLWPESGAVNGLPALDGVRALAIGLVLLFHAWNNQAGILPEGSWVSRYPIYYARTGVDLFFVLSGFLLFLPYARWLFDLQPGPSTLKFYRRRILRVGPAYWACLAVLAISSPWSIGTLGDAALHATYLFNLRPQSTFTFNSVFWTLAVEVQFYAMLPALAWLAYRLTPRLGPPRATALVVVLTIAVSAASGLVAKVVDPGRDRVILDGLVGSRSMSFYLGIFGLGIGAAAVYVYATEVARAAWRQTRLAEALVTAALLMGVALAVGLAITAAQGRLSGVNLLFGLAYAMILLGVLFGAPIVRRPFEWRPIRFIGLISYSLYLWHLVVMNGLAPRLIGLHNPTERVLAGLLLEFAIAVPVAYFFYLVSERPFINARRRAQDTQLLRLEQTEADVSPVRQSVRPAI